MDLKDLTPKSDSVEVTIKHPITKAPLTNDDGTEMTITVYAPHTAKYKTELFAQANKRINSGNDNPLTAEELEESTISLYANATKEWNITYDGEQPELTPEKAKSIYSEVFWIKEQLDQTVSSYLNFMIE